LGWQLRYEKERNYVRKTALILVVLFCVVLEVMGIGQSNRHPGALAVQHVLLLSIDGAHALDLANWIKSNPRSTFAELSGMGVTYTNASVPVGDSFPGGLSMTTGGTPNSTGAWYSNVYDRSLSPAGSDCSKIGTEVVYDQSIDFNAKLIDGGGINPAKLPRDPKKGCTLVYPHDFVRVNTVFDVAKAAGKRTAWSDKHLFCDFYTGRSGKGIDDFWIREVGMGATSVSADYKKTEEYDDLRMQAVINWIDGFDHSRTQRVGVPAIFGMTFQALGTAQKQKGWGYLDAAGRPGPEVLDALKHTDQAIGKLVSELKARNLLTSTLIVVTAVYGDSPIDPKQGHRIDEDVFEKMVGDVLAKATKDTVAFLWLKDQSQTEKVVETLSEPANKAKAGINEIVWGESLKLVFNDPLKDSRTPDIIVKPILGVWYAGPKSTKIAEHGGFYTEDVNVPLLLVNPGLTATVIKVPVPTTSVAPTILKVLGLDPRSLEAVRMEKTPLLPGLF
jgi:hypothetical protein